MRGSLATCDCRDTREPWQPLGDGFHEALSKYVRGKELATMVIVGDRETAEYADAGGYECEQKWVYGHGQDKGNDRAAHN